MRSSGSFAIFSGAVLAAFCATALTVGLKAGGGRSQSLNSLAGAPRVILWAWQRPEDLSFIDPHQTGVSYLVKTLRLKGGDVVIRKNLNGIRYPSGTWLMACARIEADRSSPPTLSRQQLSRAAAELAALANFPDAKVVQVDFDAVTSARDFYCRLLAELRRRLPPSVPISITALTSWCVSDDWISGLPVTEAVPMLFRMGPDRNTILQRLQSGGDFTEPLCRRSAGISTDEIAPRLPAGRRLYIFNPRRWTKRSLATIINVLEK